MWENKNLNLSNVVKCKARLFSQRYYQDIACLCHLQLDYTLDSQELIKLSVRALGLVHGSNNMLKILFLLNVFHQAISYNINLYGMKIQAAGQNNLKISFHIRKEIDHLTGEFSAHHKDCPNGQCGSITTGKPSKENDQGKKFTIPLHHSLSRCKSYDRVEVRAAIWHGGQNKHSANWKASCPHLTTTSRTTATTTTATTTTTSPQRHQDNISGAH